MLWNQPSFLCAYRERTQSHDGTALPTLNVSTKWRSAVSFMSWLLYLREKGPLVPHSLSGNIKERKIFSPCQEFNTLNNYDLGLNQACHQFIIDVYVSGQCVQLQIIFCTHSINLQ